MAGPKDDRKWPVIITVSVCCRKGRLQCVSARRVSHQDQGRRPFGRDFRGDLQMKLPDFTEDMGLRALLQSMGASPRAYVAPASSGQLTSEEIDRLAREGIEIPLDEVRVLEDGTLAYKNQRVVLYIRDQKQYHRSKDDALPKFHVSNCDKLREMRANNRYDRYVVSTRETGRFQINRRLFNATQYKQSEERLSVCQFCLSLLDWKQFKRARKNTLTKREVVSNFSLKEYFDEYGRALFSQLPNAYR